MEMQFVGGRRRKKRQSPPSFSEFYLTDSATRHGFDDQDVADVFSGRVLMLRSRRGYANVYEILGRNRTGEYLLVVGRVIEYEGRRCWSVFHVGTMSDADRRLYQRSLPR